MIHEWQYIDASKLCIVTSLVVINLILDESAQDILYLAIACRSMYIAILYTWISVCMSILSKIRQVINPKV